MNAAGETGEDVRDARADGVVVRVADGNDLDAVISVGHRTWLATYEPIAGPEYVAMGLAKWWTKDVVTASIRTGRTLVAEDTRPATAEGERGEVLGMATFGVQDETFYAWKLYVLPGHHGRRIGSRLMDAVLDRARDLGHEKVVLSYIEGNDQAAGFYRRHGFTEHAREDGGSVLPDSIWMSRAVDPKEEQP